MGYITFLFRTIMFMFNDNPQTHAWISKMLVGVYATHQKSNDNRCWVSTQCVWENAHPVQCSHSDIVMKVAHPFFLCPNHLFGNEGKLVVHLVDTIFWSHPYRIFFVFYLFLYGYLFCPLFEISGNMSVSSFFNAIPKKKILNW